MDDKPNRSQQNASGTRSPLFRDMSEDEFYESIKLDLIERLGISEDEFDGLTIRQIEERLDVDSWNVHKSKDRLGGLIVSDSEEDPYEYLTKSDIEEREDKVERYLDQFKDV